MRSRISLDVEERNNDFFRLLGSEARHTGRRDIGRTEIGLSVKGTDCWIDQGISTWYSKAVPHTTIWKPPKEVGIMPENLGMCACYRGTYLIQVFGECLRVTIVGNW